MNDKQLESFICIAECGSFNKAEKLLFCSKQALVQRINTLENELDFKLFERNVQGVILTDIGMEFLQGAKKILAFQKMIVDDCRSKFEQPLRIRLAKSNYRMLLQEVTFEYLRKHQDIQVELVVGFSSIDECSMVLDNMIDIGETPYKPLCNNTDLQYVKLLDISYVCLMDKNHPLANRKKLSWKELKKYNVVFNPVQYSKEYLSIIREHLPAATEMSGLSHRLKKLYEMMEENRIFITPSYHVRKLSELVCVPLDIDWTREYGLVVRKEHSFAVEQYINLAKEMFELKKY